MRASLQGVTDAAYYQRDVAADSHDYYAGHGEAPGQWAGALAERFQLAGQVDGDAFASLLGNVDPVTGGRLKKRANSVLAHDVTFSPVKTISVLWANADEATRERIVAALEGGHRHALAHLEANACVARLGAQGRDATPGEGLAAAVFRHRFSRAGDPQLHWHTVLANVAETADGRRAALDSRLLYAEAQVAAARMEVYARAELARDGVPWEQRNGYWEVAAVPARLARHYSKRREAMQDHAQATGLDLADPRQAQGAALATRPAKQAAAADVHDRWRAETAALGVDPDQLTAATFTSGGATPTATVDTLQDAVGQVSHSVPAAPPLGPPQTTSAGARGVPHVPAHADRGARRGRGGVRGEGRGLRGWLRGPRDHTADPAPDVAPGQARAGADGADPAASVPPPAEAPLTDEQVVDVLLGSNGLTEKASSFSRREVVQAVNRTVAVLGDDGEAALARLDRLVDLVLADPRCIRLLDPAEVSGEVIRPRDEHGRVTGVVKIRDANRWTTADLLTAEYELLARADAGTSADVARVDAEVVDDVLAGAGLDADQEAMVRQVTSTGAGVDVVVGKAGTGKTTALRAAITAWQSTGTTVVGVAPSAAAALQLGAATGIDASTLDRLLTQIHRGARRLPPGVVVVLDEAAMCSTRRRLDLQRAVDKVGGKVIDVGDDRQIPSVDVGGCFSLLASARGEATSTLGIVHRFRRPEFAHAAALISEGDPERAIAILEGAGAVFEHPHREVVHRRMVSDWHRLRESGEVAWMYATTRDDVAAINDLARGHLQRTGKLPRRGRRFESPDGAREIRVVVGERVRTRQNESIRQPDGRYVQVANGRVGTVTGIDRDGRITVDLDQLGEHPAATVTLPATYVGAHVDYGYAITADSSQGTTVGHGLFAPSGFGSLERGYVALSRGAITNRIYASPDTGWRERLTDRALHRPASRQTPDPDHALVQQLERARGGAAAPPLPSDDRQRGKGGALDPPFSATPAAGRSLDEGGITL